MPRPTRIRSSVSKTSPNPKLSEPEMEDEAESESAESPDPIGPDADDTFEVKQEILEKHHIKVQADKPKNHHPRQYTDEEVSIFIPRWHWPELIVQLAVILNTLGPDRTRWDRSLTKINEVCENLLKAGYMERTPGAMKFKSVIRSRIGMLS